ncbi:hypothetical protein CRE_09885 [Caenorhabditis remanei]|uniref:Uncharacterized protein n=1 Tax=Caenorhabditis remanei TaxID=31234 RepID=E3NM15_CAERE|nr:hypothetical protein CRE_09885 [Caenorhabditis remanei]
MRRARVYFGSKRQRRGVVYETHSESDEYEYLDESKDEVENTNTPVPDSGDSEEDDEEYEANYIDDLNNEFEGELFNRDEGDYAESDEDKSVSDDAEYNENERIGEGKDHRLLALVNFYCAESISEGFLQRMLHLMAVLYGESPPFSANQVMNVVTKAGRKGVKGVSYYCSRCGTEKNGKKSQCPNCPTSNINILDRLTFVKCDLKYQMTNQLIYHGREIIMAHQKIHQKEINFQSNDIRGYGRYIRSIESKADFDSQVINLLYSVFSDGAAFSKISRREVTPVLCRLEGLDMESKKGGNVYNMISMVFCDGGVKKTFLEQFVEQSFSDLPSQIEVRVDGRIWTFRLVILSYLSDMKERLLLTRLPNWHQLTGCSQCLTTGQKKSHGITYVNPRMEPLRSDASIIYASSRGLEGFTDKDKRVPSIYKYFPPSSFVIDPFHIKGSGICKTIVNEVLKPNSWTNLKLVPGAITSIINCIEGIKAYTYDNVPLASLRKLSKTTGREMEKLSRLISGIVGFEGLSLRNDYNVLFMGFLYALTLQGTGAVNPGTMQELLTTMYELHCLLEPDSLTIKFHSFYNHITLHEQEFGPIHTTEPFEREHKVLMNSVHHQTTSCENVILNK